MTAATLVSPWDEAERWARIVIAISGAGLVVWAFVRWPLVVLLKAAVLAALKSALRDDEARASFARVLREQLMREEVAQLERIVEAFEQLEQRVDTLEEHEVQTAVHPPRRSARR